ncbi:hypothetical protein KC19_VG024000 [Ceratodon purpureus]|uniref:Secreted protein n=1 Tax=Ceratodon purpureus TaxID=3225 RepID=A0A8T0HL76_CERPU|nr:hypothetical protein KC19_VG024000 [Ceratodon purpureus]
MLSLLFHCTRTQISGPFQMFHAHCLCLFLLLGSITYLLQSLPCQPPSDVSFFESSSASQPQLRFLLHCVQRHCAQSLWPLCLALWSGSHCRHCRPRHPSPPSHQSPFVHVKSSCTLEL